MYNYKVLLAEDDENLGRILKNYLEVKGFNTTLYSNGLTAFQGYQENKFDFCIIDVMMPVKDGFSLAKDIRKVDEKIPILFLTAKSLQEDILRGFQLGADDYITKPFSMEELLVRMNAILRRAKSEEEEPQPSVFTIGQYTFDYTRQLLIFNQDQQKLTSREAELLKLLCENPNQVLDRTKALIRIWKDDSYFNARSMDVFITKLRKYLKNDPRIELLNVHGVGFKLVVPV